MMISDNEKFIYVFSESAKNELLKKGYKLLKTDNRNQAFVFLNDTKLDFEKSVPSATTNIMTF